jgi:hypothetical protein
VPRRPAGRLLLDVRGRSAGRGAELALESSLATAPSSIGWIG